MKNAWQVRPGASTRAGEAASSAEPNVAATRLLLRRLADAWDVHDEPLTNRGVWALALYWYGVWAMQLRWTPIRKIFGLVYAVSKPICEIVTGVTMDRTVKIGKRPHILHAATVFIHPDTVIGDRVGIMHNVTIGTNMGEEVPVIGDDVFIGCGASILGRVHVGDGARIAANSLVINDVPAGTFAVGVPAKCMKIRSVKETREAARASSSASTRAPSPPPSTPARASSPSPPSSAPSPLAGSPRLPQLSLRSTSVGR